MSSTQKNKNINLGYTIFLGGQLGFLIALPLVVCIFLGLFFDQKSGKFPLFTLLFVFMGIVLTIIDVYKLVIPFVEKRSNK
jgi:hypothetical protein